MPKKFLLASLLALGLIVTPGCLAGPNQLGRSWDDWLNQKYSENALVHGALFQNVLPVYPIAGLLLGFVDVVMLNPFYFWSQDAWHKNGTAYQHTEVTGAKRSVDASF